MNSILCSSKIEIYAMLEIYTLFPVQETVVIRVNVYHHTCDVESD